ncbi:SLC13 family permease [Fulvivirgaceae bacterium BMA10]|uniref:SLC13 family permease n=1 Tax=Splendidivirga corallicola TaxID=3051826 RepID=A0ABT8KQA5_9BACT|nr:SLC13 family permease [Fulvivirgaceae bacterium BMA10]
MIPIDYQPYFVIAVIFLIFFFIYKNLVKPSVSFLMAMMVFLVTGVLSYKEVLVGFSNDKIATIVLLILISSSLRKNYNIELIFDRIFKQAKNYKSFLIRMMGQAAVVSSSINNAPVVALMTPYVVNWGKKNNIAPSKLLIPLSFSTIMGGMTTVIGTSTTLLLIGFLTENNLDSIKPLDLLFLGLAVTIVGILFIILIGHRLLPNHTDVIEKFKKNTREYLVEINFKPDSPLVGKSITEAELRNLRGVYLVEILRNGHVISPVEPTEVIEQNDVLIFAGDTDNIVDLINSDKGLTFPKPDEENPDHGDIEVMECVISSNSSLIGKSVKASQFRNRYDAALIAIHRDGEKISGQIGEIKLKSGDLLLLFAGANFKERVDLYRDILIISSLRKIRNIGAKKYYALGTSALLVGLLAVFGQISLFSAVLVIFSTFISFNMVTIQDIKRDLDLNLIAILVFSLALGQAILKTNAGNILALGFINLLEPFGIVAILIGLMLITNLLTSIVGNAGAISISFPLAVSLTQNLTITGQPFFLAICFAASATFLTPISYQTNLIIYGPGGYNFRDFFKIGLPMTILYLLVAVLGIVFLYKDALLP